MGQTRQQRYFKCLDAIHAVDAQRVNVVLTRGQINAVLGRFIDAQGNTTGMTWAEKRAGVLDSVLQSSLNELRTALHNR